MINDDVENIAKKNYLESSPWPEDDNWHKKTFEFIHKYVNTYFREETKKSIIVLNAGSGGTVYNIDAKVIHLDIIKDYIKYFDEYIVGSVTNIPMESNSVDVIICVGSVLNYVDAHKAISEFNRVLKPYGRLILEFERSSSAEFLFTKNYNKRLFLKEYYYNNQYHLLWLYNEKYIKTILKSYDFHIDDTKHFHIISSIFYRLMMPESNAAKFISLDRYLQYVSYPFAHNCIILCQKKY